MNIGKNIQDSFKKDAMQQYGLSLIAPFWSTVVPTLIGINGWFGFLIAYVVPLFGGLALKSVGLTSATLALIVQHLIYHFGDPMIANAQEGKGINNGNGIWALDENNLRWVYDETTKGYIPNVNYGKTLKDAPAERNYVKYGELPAGAKIVEVGGEKVAVYDANTINDYILDGDNLAFGNVNLNDYLNTEDISNERLMLPQSYKQVM